MTRCILSFFLMKIRDDPFFCLNFFYLKDNLKEDP